MSRRYLHIHSGKDIPVHLQFPPKRSWCFWRPASYEVEASVVLGEEVQQRHSLARGRANLTDEREIKVEFDFAGPEKKDLDLAVGILFPDYTMPQRLRAVGERAVAVLNPRDAIDLEAREGQVILFFEEVE